jgi:hypothetical protein
MAQRSTRLGMERLEARETPAIFGTPGFPAPLATSGPADGVVSLFAPIFGTGQFNTPAAAFVTPFPGFAGQIRPALGDVNGDAIPDLVLVSGPGGPTRLVVIDGRDYTTPLTGVIDPLGDAGFTGGAFVAVGDIDNDGRGEVVVSPDLGGGPRVVIFSFVSAAIGLPGTLTLRGNFFGIDDPNFRGGARVAVGDVNADGFADVVVAAGFGGGPRVAIYSGLQLVSGGTGPVKLVPDFFAFDGPDAETLRNGVFVAAGDLNADTVADLVFGAGPGGGPRVLAISGRLLVTSGIATAQAQPLANFFFGSGADRGGVRVAAKEVGIGTRAEIVAASGENLPSRVRVEFGQLTGGEPNAFQDIDPYGQILPGGIYVG